MARGKPGRYLLALLVSICVIVPGMNLLWLAASTVRIENASRQVIARAAFSACDRLHEVGPLEPGESVFRLLPACGDDTLEILLGEARFCRIYIEGEMYHVDAEIRSASRVDCRYDHLFAGLLAAKLL